MAEHFEDFNYTTLVKIDHIIYKSNVYSSVLNEKENEDFTQPDECDFGRWYYSDGKERFGTTSAYKSLGKKHEIVHDKANANVKYIKDHTVFSHEDDIIGNFSVMEEASSDVFDLLDTILEEKAKNKGIEL
ncbi:MAG: CZB domain-containing protein [Campylobacterota bacterium]